MGKSIGRGHSLFVFLLLSASVFASTNPNCDTGKLTSNHRATPEEIAALAQAPNALSYEDYLKFKARNIDRPADIDYTQFDPVVSRFYRENYPGRTILIFADDEMNQSSGVAVVMKNMKERLEKKTGLQVVFVTPTMFKYSKTFMMPGQGQKFHGALPTHSDIAAFIQKYKPAAIHVMVELPVGNVARDYLNRKKIPYTTAFHTEWPTFISSRFNGVLKFARPAIEELVYKYLRWFHRNSKGIMSPSRSITEKLILNRFDPTKVRQWSHGVDLDLFKPEKRDETLFPRLAAAQGREAKPPYLLMVSRLSGEKNPELFFRTKIASGTKFFAGPGTPAETARLKKLYPDVIFLGNKDYKTELPSLYASADAFVFPGTRETLGLVNGEALASGTPVVAFDVQGPKDVIKDPKAGVLVPFDKNQDQENVDRLSAAIPEALKLDRGNVRKFAETLSWDFSVSEFMDFLHPLTDDHLRRAR